MRYILLKAPDEGLYFGQIEIIDNSNELGERRVERLCEEGYTPCGFIESDLSHRDLKSCFRSDADKTIDELRSKEREIIHILNR